MALSATIAKWTCVHTLTGRVHKSMDSPIGKIELSIC